ncbi:unnamed protein product [Schistosoma turkestanicum]|nr:unnamed protein product [Schistosoma turkestanicum]
MEDSRGTRIFVLIGLALAICFTLVAIIGDNTLTAQYKSHSLKAFQAFYFLAFIAFIAALVLYLLTIFKEGSKIFRIGIFAAIVVGCVCCIISVIMYYDHLSRYYDRNVRPDSSSWLLAVILASFELALFVFIYILY